MIRSTGQVCAVWYVFSTHFIRLVLLPGAVGALSRLLLPELGISERPSLVRVSFPREHGSMLVEWTLDDIERLIATATASDAAVKEKHRAFGEIVRRYQDLAFGCAYAVLGDFQLAQDAAQEAFVAA